MLLSSAIGYGTLSARPTAGSAGRMYYATDTQLLYRDNGASWDTLTIASTGPTTASSAVLLDFAQTTDLNVTLPNATWTDIIANQNFTVTDAASVVEIAVSGLVFLNLATVGHFYGARVVVDSAGTAITKMISGGNAGYGGQGNLLTGTAPVCITGLAAATHTVKLQGWIDGGTATNNATCLVVTRPNSDSLQMRVLERIPA